MSLEKQLSPQTGLPWLLLTIALWLAALAAFIGGIILGSQRINPTLGAYLLVSTPIIIFLAVLAGRGLTVIAPNECRVFLLFGRYVGSCRKEGFWWVNPFFTKKTISLRLRTLNGERIKVNDNAGNPIEIASIVVWNVEDAYAACFDVNDYVQYVTTQSESALRHLASLYPYDSWDESQPVSLRGHIDVVSKALEHELLERLSRAGVRVHEARLSHLAYAPEIAEAMLRRQQASAIIAARQKIVEGAVGMVQMALHLLNKDNIVQLDEERKASMVCNLLVVLCGESNAQPVINAGTLYH